MQKVLEITLYLEWREMLTTLMIPAGPMLVSKEEDRLSTYQLTNV